MVKLYFQYKYIVLLVVYTKYILSIIHTLATIIHIDSVS